MDDRGVEGVVQVAPTPPWPLRVVHVPRQDSHLPLARARNVGVSEAVAAGCERLVLLDVDCIPSAGLVDRYCEVLGSVSTQDDGAPRVLCGEVAYLPLLPEGMKPSDPDRLGTARPHPARPVLATDAIQVEQDVTRFWSLSFAMTVPDWCTVGGFDEAYVGYGGEDTDYGQRLRSAGGQMLWVGGAGAFHQYHPVRFPPVQHLEDIVRNANLFAQRWGWWPMEGWLAEFAGAGLAVRSSDGRWHAVPT
ncbi:MAG: galactosyltransferase-related protein [Ornithinibacter sp.]